MLERGPKPFLPFFSVPFLISRGSSTQAFLGPNPELPDHPGTQHPTGRRQPWEVRGPTTEK